MNGFYSIFVAMPQDSMTDAVDVEEVSREPLFTNTAEHTKSPKFDHGHGVWGDPQCGPVGRLDAGHLEVLQVSMNLRREHKVHFTNMRLESILNAMEDSEDAAELESPPIDVFTTFQYGIVSDDLRYVF